MTPVRFCTNILPVRGTWRIQGTRPAEGLAEEHRSHDGCPRNFDLADPDRGFDADARWWMTEAEVVPYSKELDDTIPVGTVMPAVLIKEGFAGDRADVRAGAKWQDGVWTLEVSRELATSSPTDLEFELGADLFMWVAVFDHTRGHTPYATCPPPHAAIGPQVLRSPPSRALDRLRSLGTRSVRG